MYLNITYLCLDILPYSHFITVSILAKLRSIDRYDREA